MAAQGGANLIYGAGMLELGICFDVAQFVMDNEMYRMIRKAVAGIDITDVNIAIDVIKEIGAGGEFISHNHTFNNFRNEQSQAGLIDRSMRETWQLGGSTSFTDRAYDKALDIIENHQVPPLAPGVAETIRSIVEDTEAEYGLK